MNASRVLVDEHMVVALVQVLQHELEEVDKLVLGKQLDPLVQNVHESPLEDYVAPLVLLEHL